MIILHILLLFFFQFMPIKAGIGCPRDIINLTFSELQKGLLFQRVFRYGKI